MVYGAPGKKSEIMNLKKNKKSFTEFPYILTNNNFFLH